MPRPSQFTPYGMLTYSRRKSHAQAIYDVLIEGLGDSFDTSPDQLETARIYAAAMVLGSAQYMLDRAGNNRNPLKATELLALLERDYQIVPGPTATLNERRRELAARAKLTKGNRRGAIEYALRALLGDAFIEYRTTSKIEIQTVPFDIASTGVFAPPGTEKKTLALTECVATIGRPFSVGYRVVAGGDPVVGEAFCVDPDPRTNIEQVTVLAVANGRLTALFQKSHEIGSLAVRPHPYWSSNQRLNTIVVSPAAASDPETRRKIHELLRRALRGVSTWQIVSNAGFFTSDDPVLGLPDSVLVA